MDTTDIVRIICVLIVATSQVYSKANGMGSGKSLFEGFNTKFYGKGNLLDFGPNLYPDASGGFTFTEKTANYRFEPTTYFDPPVLPEDFSITAVFTPKKSEAFLFALLSPDMETIRLGLSINRTKAASSSAHALNEIFFYYNDDVKSFGYQKPVIKAAVPEFLEKPDSITWKVAVYVNRTKASIYFGCNGESPEFEGTIERKSMANDVPFFGAGSSLYVMSGGPVYKSKFEGNIVELRVYSGKEGVRQRCTNFNRWPTDDSEGGSGLEENKFVGNVFRSVFTTTTKKPLPTASPSESSADSTVSDTISESLATPTPTKAATKNEALQSNPADPTQRTIQKKEAGCGKIQVVGSEFEDKHRPPCRKNFMKTSSTAKPTTTTAAPTTTTPTTTTAKPTTTTAATTIAVTTPKPCVCKGIKGDVGPPGPPGKACKKRNKNKKMEIGGEWMLMADTTVAPQGPPVKGEKGDRGEPGKMGLRGERGFPGLPCQPPPGGKVVAKGGKVKYVEGSKEWELLDTTAAPTQQPTTMPSTVPSEKGMKGEPGEPGRPGKPYSGIRVVKKEGRLKYIENGTEYDLFKPTKSRSIPGPKGPAGPPGPRGEPGVCPSCNVTEVEGTQGEKGEPGVCTKPCVNGRDGRRGDKGERGLKGEPGNKVDLGNLRDKVIEMIKHPAVRPLLMGAKGEPGTCNKNPKTGGGCALDAGCVNNCNRGPPGPPGQPGIGLDKLSDFGYGAVTFRNTNDFFGVASYFPAGSIVYIERGNDGQPKMYIKSDGTNNRWREMNANFGAPMDIPMPRTTVKPTPPVPEAIRGSDETVHQGRKLVMFALDELMRGNIGDLGGNGHAVAEHRCEKSARMFNLDGDFGAVLGHEYLQLRSLVAPMDRSTVPIVNIKNVILFKSWTDFLGGARMNPDATLETVRGVNVLDKRFGGNRKMWLGSNKKGETKFGMTPTCRLWTSASSRQYGLAADFSNRSLMESKPLACSQKAFVLCVRTTMRALVYRRKK